MTDKQSKTQRKPIRITHMNVLTFIVTIVIAIVFIVVTIISADAFKQVENNSQKCITCEADAKLLQDASNYLTEQARLFVATGDSKYMEAYFTEAKVTRRRENAVESLSNYFSGTESMNALEAALDSSIELMNTEYLAMHVAAIAYGYNDADLPEEVAAADISLLDDNNTDLRASAINLMAGDEYQAAKNTISTDVERCLSGLISQTEEEQNDAIRIYQTTQVVMIVVCIFLVIFMLMVCLFTYKNIVIPLKRHKKSIKSGEPLSIVGVAELQEVSITFNKVFKEHQDAMRIIRHEAEHDELTGVYNRRSFNKLLSIYEEEGGEYALMIMDVDFFKQINDNNGHEVGDKILQKVASTIKSSFRASDHVCRIGGDEFAVIVADVEDEHIDIIKKSVENINKELSKTDDGLPPVTLSVGGAVSSHDTNDTEKIFNEADSALYTVKKNGRNGCEITASSEQDNEEK